VRVVVLASGRGSNLEAIIARQVNYKVVGVVSDVPDAKALSVASQSGIPSKSINGKELKKDALTRPLIDAVNTYSPDWVVLAGFLRIVRAEFIQTFGGKVINIHPSLLPKYPGIDTHEKVLAAGEVIHGCTVHLVDEGVDTGQTIAQAIVPVLKDDSLYTLSDRVLDIEHQIFPWVLNGIGSGDITILGSKVTFTTNYRAEGKKLGFVLPHGDRI